MSEEKSYKIFVGGLSQDTDDSSFKEHFIEFGEVTESRVMTTKDLSGNPKSRGFGFVTYADKESFENCLGKEHRIDGKIVEVKKAVPRNAVAGSSTTGQRKANVKKVFLGGLSKEATDAEITEAVEGICGEGTVAEVKIMTDKVTNESRGFGFAIMRDPCYTPEDPEYDEAAYAIVDKLVANKFIKIGEREVEVKTAKSVDEMKREEETKAPARPFFPSNSFGYGRDASMMYPTRNPYAMGSGYYGGSSYDYLQQQRAGRDYGMSAAAYASMYDRAAAGASYGYDSSAGIDYSKYYSQYSGMMPGSYPHTHSSYGPTRGYSDYKERSDRGSDSRSGYHPYRR